jgi:hypothetical protein
MPAYTLIEAILAVNSYVFHERKLINLRIHKGFGS